MILKKQEQETKTKAIYSSSNICASIYDNMSGELTIMFNHGGRYKYDGVSKSDYMRFEIADSQGSVMNTHIKKYPTTKLDNIDVTEILKEVKLLTENTTPPVTREVATKEMLSAMVDIISNHFKNGNVTLTLVAALKDKISQFEGIVKNG